MKKLILLMMFAGVWFAACDNKNLSPDSTTELADMESVVASAARYSLSSDSVTLGKCKGKLTEVATADLAAAITDYITATYAGSSIKYAAKDAAGLVIVAIELADGSARALLFNADGTFKEELLKHGHKATLTQIEVSTLSAAITSYITATYAGATIKQAATNADGQFFVRITVNETTKILLFNADGTFNQELSKPAKRHK